MADLPKELSRWGNDELTKYIDSSRRHQFATFHRKGKEVDGLIRIDRAFHTFFAGATNIRPWFPAQFALRAHSAFKASSAAAMAGQLYDLNATLRSCLELAGYGLYIGDSSNRAKIWLGRHDSAASLAAMKSEFTIRHMKDHLRSIAPRIADGFDKLYEEAIDFGAHPNEQGFSGNMSIVDRPDSKEFHTIYLEADGGKIGIALKRTGQIGLWALLAVQLLWKERFELLGIREEIDALRKLY